MTNINRRDLLSNSLKLGSFLQEKKQQEYYDSLDDYYFIRPPGALAESDFLKTCTRCQACVEACPYFAIENDYKNQFDDDKYYPALNVGHVPCHMCEDYPCIKVCEPKALIMPEQGKKTKIGEAQILINTCLSWQGEDCNLCHSQCPEQALVFDNDKHTRVINSRCTGCGLCIEVCPEGEYAIKVVSIAEVESAKKTDA